jgi:ArsR family transcriptional regulator, arsenate/arsenite/antimonite-responsive transcriptional repressor
MKPAQAVTALAALAHEHRLAIYRLLVEAGPEGQSRALLTKHRSLL